MKKISQLIIPTLLLVSNYVFSQTYTTKTLVTTTKYLCSLSKSYLGGTSRIPILVELPPNTVEWYYSFSTSEGESGTAMLNLGIQLYAASQLGPLGASAAKQIEVPKGSNAIDVLLISVESKKDFELEKDDKVLGYEAYCSLKASQAVMPINKLLTGSYYLGLKNTNNLNGINVTVEVVAIVEEADPNADKGQLYGSMGWKAYEKGELDKCVELSLKALSFNPNLAWVKFNIALTHMAQGKDQALDEYIEAISICKKDPNPKNSLSGALDDINNLRKIKGNLNYMDDIEVLIKRELSKY